MLHGHEGIHVHSGTEAFGTRWSLTDFGATTRTRTLCVVHPHLHAFIGATSK